MGWHGMAWDGVGWDGITWHGMGWGVTGWGWHGKKGWHGMGKALPGADSCPPLPAGSPKLLGDFSSGGRPSAAVPAGRSRCRPSRHAAGRCPPGMLRWDAAGTGAGEIP